MTQRSRTFVFFFFFNDTATTEIYTLSLHDALPISVLAGGPDVRAGERHHGPEGQPSGVAGAHQPREDPGEQRSEEHTSELQSRPHLVCRLLLEKKKKQEQRNTRYHGHSVPASSAEA